MSTEVILMERKRGRSMTVNMGVNKILRQNTVDQPIEKRLTRMIATILLKAKNLV